MSANHQSLDNQSSERRVLKRLHVDPSHLLADRGQLSTIVDDLQRFGGIYTPRATWITLDPRRRPDEMDRGDQYIADGFADLAVAKRMATMDRMLAPWIGAQRYSVNAKVLRRYGDYIHAHDPLDLWSSNVANADILARYTIADLGSMIDLNFLHSYASFSTARRPVILEIGGGYGRLTEAAFNVLGRTLRYVLVDSVPGSLLYAREYLRRACPQIQLGTYYDGDPFELDRYDCYIIPSWHFEKLNNGQKYDICINIESFQEMSQEQVDIYLRWFSDIANDGALIYLSNAHDYKFNGEWNYPITWRRMLCARIPRAWTSDHRTEVFIKGTGDYSLPNAAIEAAYHWNLQHRPYPSSRLLQLGKRLLRSPLAADASAPSFARSVRHSWLKDIEGKSAFKRTMTEDWRAQQKFKAYRPRRRASD